MCAYINRVKRLITYTIHSAYSKAGVIRLVLLYLFVYYLSLASLSSPARLSRQRLPPAAPPSSPGASAYKSWMALDRHKIGNPVYLWTGGVQRAFDAVTLPVAQLNALPQLVASEPAQHQSQKRLRSAAGVSASCFKQCRLEFRPGLVAAAQQVAVQLKHPDHGGVYPLHSYVADSGAVPPDSAPRRRH